MAAKASPNTTSALPACSVRAERKETSRRAHVRLLQQRIEARGRRTRISGSALSCIATRPALSRPAVERHPDGQELPLDVRDELRVARAEARLVRLEVIEVGGDQGALGAG